MYASVKGEVVCVYVSPAAESAEIQTGLRTLQSHLQRLGLQARISTPSENHKF